MQRNTYIIRYIEHLRRFRIRRVSCSIHPTHPECEPHQVGILAPWGELERGFHKQQQRCRCCVSPAQGCGRKHATLGTRPHHHGNAVSVALSRRRYPQWANNPKISVSDRISLQKILVLGHKSTKKISVSDRILP